MELKYVGPKPIISHTGIEFDNNKDDKYSYLNITLQLVKALSHDYFEDKTYTYNTDTTRFSSDELLHELSKVCPNLFTLIEEKNHAVEEEIQHNIDRANQSNTLTDEDKDVLKKNIEMMREYILQRSINKSVYYCAIKKLADLVKHDHIDYIIAPMFQNFAHILHSVQGILRNEKFPIDSKLEIFQKNGKLLVKLDVINT